MKYVATINGKKYEVEVEKLEAYKSLDRNGVAAPVAPVLPASAPVIFLLISRKSFNVIFIAPLKNFKERD